MGIYHRQTITRKLLCGPGLDTRIAEALWSDADQLMERGQILKCKPRDRSKVVRLALNGREYVVKRYNLLGWAHTTRHLVLRSRAMRCWLNALRLRDLGVLTPAPLAVYEQRYGPLRQRAFFVSEFIEGVTLGEEIRDNRACGQGLERLAEQFADLWQKLGRARIRQRDMHARNFIVARDSRLWMIDLDGMRRPPFQGYPYEEKRAKDRARFFKNWRGMPEISEVFAARMDALEDTASREWLLRSSPSDNLQSPAPRPLSNK